MTPTPKQLAEASAEKAHENFDSSCVVRWEFIECHKQGFLAGHAARDAEVEALKRERDEARDEVCRLLSERED